MLDQPLRDQSSDYAHDKGCISQSNSVRRHSMKHDALPLCFGSTHAWRVGDGTISWCTLRRIGRALLFYDVTDRAQLRSAGCATHEASDGLMVSSTSAIYSKNPSPGSPRAGASPLRAHSFSLLLPTNHGPLP